MQPPERALPRAARAGEGGRGQGRGQGRTDAWKEAQKDGATAFPPLFVSGSRVPTAGTGFSVLTLGLIPSFGSLRSEPGGSSETFLTASVPQNCACCAPEVSVCCTSTCFCRKVFFLISRSSRRLFKSMLFNLHMVVNFPVFFL